MTGDRAVTLTCAWVVTALAAGLVQQLAGDVAAFWYAVGALAAAVLLVGVLVRAATRAPRYAVTTGGELVQAATPSRRRRRN